MLGSPRQVCWAEELPITELLSDVRYSTACGPISCFAAAHFFGRSEASLDEMARLCNWSEGRTTSLNDIATALESHSGLHVQGVRLSPEQLEEILTKKKYAAILTVRRNSNEVNHAVFVFCDENGAVSSVDYPNLRQSWSNSKLADEWDGKALLISQQPETDWRIVVAECTLPGAVVALLIHIGISRVRTRSVLVRGNLLGSDE